jgi:hypothetical protein
MATAKKEVTKSEEPVEQTSMVQDNNTMLAERPSWVPEDSSKGSEDVTINDLVLPRVDVLQALSPQIKKTDPQYIPHSEQGIIFNTVSGELYGSQITIVPVVFRREFIIWQSRKSGGGFRGSFPTAEEAEEERQNLENPNDHEVVETHVNFVLIIHPNGRTEEAVLSWSKSKRKVSRKMNSLVQMVNANRYARAYKLTAIPVIGPKGEYWSFDVGALGFVTKPVYDRAEASYEAIRRGERSVQHDQNEAEAESAVV